ncbi:MAG: sigma-70 family RNA polymerase sigma factor [Ramlibacter sp.]|nr:sigma-70 family RNA polymerase sigma factor [Ramlibacter sp.]
MNVQPTHSAPATRVTTGLQRSGAVCSAEMYGHRDYLVRFARRKLHDPMLAEDVVHDVFEAVLSGRAVFEGRSALRSWLVAVLKHKLVDLIRERSRYAELDDGSDENDTAGTACEAARPDELAEQRERLAQVLARLDQLPQGLRDVMHWRVLRDESTEAVCKRLAISPEAMFVRLHRARHQLLC